MVSKEELEELFEIREGYLYGKHVSWRRKESNTRVSGKRLGTVTPDGYRTISFKTKDGKKYRMLCHRVIFYMTNGYLPKLVDHKDQNPHNDKPDNLRDADKSINALNTPVRSNNKTGVKGVFRISSGKYEASIWKNGKKNYSGLFETVESAKSAIEESKNDF